MLSAILTGLAEGIRLALSIFKARNSPAMQAAARAATIQKIRDSVNQHIASGDVNAVRTDGAP